MIFNGHTEKYINTLDEETFAEIQVMYADGMLGNKSIFDALGPITTALFNYIRSANSPAYRQDQIFPCVNEYAQNPDLIAPSTVSSNLLSYISQSKGFKQSRFKRG